MPQKKNNALGVVRFSAIGDVAIALPALYALCRRYPQQQVVFVTRPHMTKIFVNPPSNLTLFGADVDGEYSGPAGLNRLASHLIKTYGITRFVDLHNVLRTRVLGLCMKLRGVPVSTLVKDRAGRRALTRPKNKVKVQLEPVADRYCAAFAAAGFPVEPDFVSIFDGQSVPAEMYTALADPKTAGERWVGIAPFAAHRGKIYPEELMEQVVDALAAKDGVKIFLFGGGDDEQRIMGAWQEKHPGVVKSLAGIRAGFAAEMALMACLDVMLTMDSANMHLAALAGTKVISIWGATHAFAGFAGHRQGADSRIEVDMDCRPCSVYGNKPCARGDMACMRSITPERVVARLEEALS